MRAELVTERGEPAGGIDLPEDVLKASQQVSLWMYQHEIRELGTLCCLRVSPGDGYLVRLPAEKKSPGTTAPGPGSIGEKTQSKSE